MILRRISEGRLHYSAKSAIRASSQRCNSTDALWSGLIKVGSVGVLAASVLNSITLTFAAISAVAERPQNVRASGRITLIDQEIAIHLVAERKVRTVDGNIREALEVYVMHSRFRSAAFNRDELIEQ